MKKILYLIVLVICIGVYIAVYFYYIPSLAEATFEQKLESLEMDIKKQIKEAWENDNAFLFFNDYGGAKYLRMDMDVVRYIDKREDAKRPPYGLAWNLFPNGRYGNSVRMAFESLQPGAFSDLYELYYIQSKPWIGTYIAPDQDLYSIKVFNYYPLFIGYKTGNISLRNYRPSLDECCIDAKKYIQEEDKDNRMYYKPQNEEKVNKIFNLRNDYYYFQFRSSLETSTPDSYINEFNFATFNFHNHDKYNFPTGTLSWIYNGFYKVYYLTQRSGTMYLSFNDTRYNQELNSFISDKRSICNIVFLILIIISVISLAIIHTRNKKTNVKEKHLEKSSDIVSPIYEKVVNLSNPVRFIKPYQPDKLEKANRIYSNALNNKDNIDILEKLLEEAMAL